MFQIISVQISPFPLLEIFPEFLRQILIRLIRGFNNREQTIRQIFHRVVVTPTPAIFNLTNITFNLLAPFVNFLKKKLIKQK